MVSMPSTDKTQKTDVAKPLVSGEQERDNDARRPDGSTGTEHDSTAQKAARSHAQPKH
ncbi:YpzI family protein [Pseudomonas soli]